MTNLSSEDRVDILEYKFVFEEDIKVKKEFLDGSVDLNYRLSFFRSKLAKQPESTAKTENFDATFFGTHPDNKIDPLESDIDINNVSAVKSGVDAVPWVKSLYRKIVMITHPDKTSGVQSVHLREQLADQYRIAQNAYNKKVYSDLIMIGFDLNLVIPSEVIKENIKPHCQFKKNKINETKKKIGWQWFHLPENLRDRELKKILALYGFSFTEEKVKDVVSRKYVKRKVGTKPKKFNVKRRKLK